jgi:acylphosphatase
MSAPEFYTSCSIIAPAAPLTCRNFACRLAAENMRKRAHVIYSGRVQGVGFRYSVREVACGFEVTGFARNLPDGRVELVAEGEEDELKGFLDAIHQSQLGNYIRGEDVNWKDASSEFTRFEIRL